MTGRKTAGSFLSRRNIGQESPRDLKTRMQRQKADERASLFLALCKRQEVPEPTREHKFAAPDRQWRFDFAWPDRRVALEVEGAVWVGGRHTRGAGFLADMEKYNCAASRGWLVLRCTPDTLDSLTTVHLIRTALGR